MIVNFTYLFLLAISVLLITGYMCIKAAFTGGRTKAFKYGATAGLRTKNYFQRQLADSAADELFAKIDVNLNTYQYNLIRFALLIFVVFLGILKQNLIFAVLSILFIAFLTPKEHIISIKTKKSSFELMSPFVLIMTKIRETYSKKLDTEIYTSCVLLKNISAVQTQEPWGAEYILSQLYENSKLLKSKYRILIQLHRLGKEEEAFKKFAESIGTKTSEKFAQILSTLDAINPVESVKQVTELQESLQESRVTEEMRKTELKSYLVSMMATATSLILMLNFVLVVIILDVFNLIGSFTSGL